MINRVLKLMHKRKKQFIFAVVCYCVLEMASSVFVPISIKGITNGAVEKDVHMIVVSIFTWFCVFLAWWIFAPISQIILDKNTYKTMFEFRKKLSKHILNLPMKYFDRTPTGEIISNYTADMDCLHNLVHRNMEQVIRKILGGVVGLIVMAIFDYRFAIIVFLLGCLSIFISNYFTNKMEAKSNQLLEQRANTTCDFSEMIKAAKNIRIFKCEAIKKKEISENVDKEKKYKLDKGYISAKMDSVIITIGIVTYLSMLFIGCVFVYYNWSDWGSVIAIISMKTNTDMLFSEFPQQLGEMKVNIAGVKRLFRLYDLPEEKPLQKQFNSNDNLALEMKNVTFSYDEANYVLQNFNMAIGKNSITIIKGESGKGKSTIIKLILGLYNAKEGKILFNKETPSIAYVPQEAQLFRDTIYENIVCGSNNAKEEDVINAARKANIDEFVNKLPQTYNTILNDDGNSLSGGQKQRIALARALVSKSDIILLDEVTSALDRQSKYKMLDTIVNLKKDHTIIFVTHDKYVENISDTVISL